MNEAGSEVEDIESDTEAVGEETSSNLAKPFLSCSRMLSAILMNDSVRN
jgi:hypothetical protein